MRRGAEQRRGRATGRPSFEREADSETKSRPVGEDRAAGTRTRACFYKSPRPQIAKGKKHDGRDKHHGGPDVRGYPSSSYPAPGGDDTDTDSEEEEGAEAETEKPAAWLSTTSRPGRMLG